MRHYKSTVSLLLGLSFLLAANISSPDQEPESSIGKKFEDSDVAFPTNYRTEFTNYLSLDRVQNPDQVIRLFANDIAMQGPGEDGRLPMGSILVGEVYKAKLDESGEVIISSLGRRVRGKLALVAVMERREEPATYPENLDNGHWRFGAFKPDGADAGKDLNQCRECHAPLDTQNHVFSLEHFPSR